VSGRDPRGPGTPWPDPPTVPPGGPRVELDRLTDELPTGHPQGTLRQRLADGPGYWHTDRQPSDAAGQWVSDLPPDPECGRVPNPDLGGIARQCGWRRAENSRTDDRSEWMGYVAEHGARLGRATEALAAELLASARELRARERAEGGGSR